MSNSNSRYEPNFDWKLGDDHRTWPHGFVQHSMMPPDTCGVVIDNDSMRRCERSPDDNIHAPSAMHARGTK